MKQITSEEYESAKNFIKNCSIMFPENDLMDSQTTKDLLNCYRIVHYYEKQNVVEEVDDYPYEQEIKKPRKIGKIEAYKETVKECLRQGYGEERQLLDEAYARKNPFARKNYVKAYYQAYEEFMRE